MQNKFLSPFMRCSLGVCFMRVVFYIAESVLIEKLQGAGFGITYE